MPGEQTSFLTLFGDGLDPRNRWMVKARLVPWDVVETVYGGCFNGLGRRPLGSRIAVGALIIQETLSLTDRETVEQIRENPYLQAFLGYGSFSSVARFDDSTLSLVRERLGAEGLQRINGAMIDPVVAQHALQEAGGDPHEPTELAEKSDGEDPHGPPPSGGASSPPDVRGDLLIDATCAPADVTFPTDLKLLNHAREISEQVIDRLHEPFIGQRVKPRTYRDQARRDFLRTTKQKRVGVHQRKKSARQQLRYLRRNMRTIAAFIDENTTCLRDIPCRLYLKFLVIGTIIDQQTIVSQPGVTRVDDRIVNLAQPHVRPIIRGKAGNRTEFGAKISVSHIYGYATLDVLSWDASNEAADLPGQAEQYRQRTGFYPRRICADKIYRTRANRKWCTDRGIRLAGPGPGRPLKEPEARHQQQLEARGDEAARQPIEGIFGRAKRRYRLSRIMAKLSRTAGAAIALVFLVMNLERLFVPGVIPMVLALLASLVAGAGFVATHVHRALSMRGHVRLA